MKNSGYFRIIGVIELLASIAAIIWWSFIMFSGQYKKMSIDPYVGFAIWFSLLFLSPSFGLLCLSHANVLNKIENK